MTGHDGPPWSWGPPQGRDEPLPCDDLVAEPRTTMYRAVDVTADPHTTYAWLCQLRAAPYSYDLLDNLGRRSPRRRTPS